MRDHPTPQLWQLHNATLPAVHKICCLAMPQPHHSPSYNVSCSSTSITHTTSTCRCHAQRHTARTPQPPHPHSHSPVWLALMRIRTTSSSAAPPVPATASAHAGAAPPKQRQQQHHRPGQQHTSDASSLDRMLQDDQPLDEQQQEAVITALEREAVSSARFFGALFASIAVVGAGMLLYAALHQAVAPWQYRWAGAELRPVADVRAVCGVLLLQALALAAAGAALLLQLPPLLPPPSSSPAAAGAPPCTGAAPPPPPQPPTRSRARWGVQARWLLVSSVAGSGVAACYWAGAMQASITKYGRRLGAHWELLWLPLGPLGYSCACWHVHSSFSAVEREVQSLRRLSYGLKGV